MTAPTLPLLYPGRLNSIFGESGGGKSWIAFAAVLETIRRGRRARVLDWEDSALGIVERLDLLGVTPAEIALVDYRNPSSGLMRGVERLEAEQGDPVDLVVIDSVGEAMAAGGVNSNDDAEVAVWFNLARRLTRLPGTPAVVLLDHIPKSTDAPALYSIGSQRKRAAINGASYRIDTLREPAQGRDGKWKLTVAKDRIGNRAKGTTAAIVDVTSTDAGIELFFHVTDAQEAEVKGQAFRPTVLMERVSRYLEDVGTASRRSILRDVTGKRDAIYAAIDALTSEDYITVEAGDKGAVIHRLAKAFRADSAASLVDCGHRGPTVAHRGPGHGPTTTNATVAPVAPTPPTGGADGATVAEGRMPSTRDEENAVEGHGPDDPTGPIELPY